MTVVDIWNNALALIPHDVRIVSEDDDSTEAMRCREHWQGARRSVLSRADWGWATESIPVAPMGAVIRPLGALRILGLYNPHGRRVRMLSENGLIRSQSGDACKLRMILDREDVEDWPSWFADAVTAELASRIAFVITGNPSVQTAVAAVALQRLRLAMEIDANEASWSGTDGRSFANARR